METQRLFLTGLDTIREFVSPWVGFLISVLALLAFWPKIKASVIGRLTTENIRLRGIIADMTIEEGIKNVIVAAEQKHSKELAAQVLTLESELLEIHREQFEQIHHSKNPQSPAR